MDEAAENFRGWSLQQAIDRLVSTKSRGALTGAREARDSAARAPRASFLTGGREAFEANEYADYRLRDARERYASARGAVLKELNDLGSAEKIIAFGCPDKQDAPLKRIDRHRWFGFSEFNEEVSFLGQGSSGYYSVGILPLLEYPGAAKHLKGSLGDLIATHVLEDAELLALAPDNLPNLLDTVGKGGVGAILVPISGNKEIIRQCLSQSGLGVSPKGTEVLASRLGSLGRMIRAGEIRLAGIREGDEDAEDFSLPLNEISHPSARLCLATGDLWHASSDGNRKVFHRVAISDASVSVPEAIEPSAGAAPEQDLLYRVPPKSNAGVSSGIDYREAFLSVLVESLKNGKAIATRQRFYGAVQDWAKKSDKAVPTDGAIGKMIRENYPGIGELLDRITRKM